MDTTNNLKISELQMLGRQDFDINYPWNKSNVSHEMHEIAKQFISTKKLQFDGIDSHLSAINTTYQLAPKELLALHLIVQHHTYPSPTNPLSIIIQGTTSTSKSFWIDCIRKK